MPDTVKPTKPPPQQALSPPPPMLGEELAADDPNNSEQRIFLETISPQHWGERFVACGEAGGRGGSRIAAPITTQSHPGSLPFSTLLIFLRHARGNDLASMFCLFFRPATRLHFFCIKDIRYAQA